MYYVNLIHVHCKKQNLNCNIRIQSLLLALFMYVPLKLVRRTISPKKIKYQCQYRGKYYGKHDYVIADISHDKIYIYIHTYSGLIFFNTIMLMLTANAI